VTHHPDPQLHAAHSKSSNHRADIEASLICGCYYCRTIFEPSEIAEWVDRPDDPATGQPVEAGQTALCPHCGVDSVIGAQSGYPITPEFLAAMHQYWFG
jgi:hypothetical protein